MKVLIVGGSYFLGNGIIEALKQNNAAIYVLNRGSKLISDTHQLIADRNDCQALSQAIGKNYFDLVIDTCCYSVEQAQILQAIIADQYSYFINISSASVYSDGSNNPPYHESFARNGHSIWGEYGIQKALVDQYLYSLNKNITSLIPPYLYGKDNYLDREHLLFAMILADKSVHIPNDGQTYLHFITPQEIGDIIIKLFNSHKKLPILNVASELAKISMVDYVHLLFDIAEKPYKITHVDYQKKNIAPRDFFSFRDCDLRLNTNSLHNIFGWKGDLDIKDELTMILNSLDNTI